MPTLRAQIDEALLLLASTSADEFAWRGSQDDQHRWGNALRDVEDGRDVCASESIPNLAFALRLDESLWLHVDYLDDTNGSIASFLLHGPQFSQATLQPYREKLEKQVTEARRQELDNVVFDAFTAMQVYLTEHALPDREERGQRSAEPQGSTMPLLDNVEMLRVIFWTHHLKAPSKKRDMNRWCAELDIFGLVKSGYPGILCFEGTKDSVQDMVRRIKSLQWHAITVKTEVSFTYRVPDDCVGTEALSHALLACCLARGHSSTSASVGKQKLRTCMDEVETGRQLVDRLRLGNVPEDEWMFALNLRS